MEKIEMDNMIILSWGLYAIGSSMIFSSLIIAFMEPNPASILLTCLGLFIIGYTLNIHLTTAREINNSIEEFLKSEKFDRTKQKVKTKLKENKLK